MYEDQSISVELEGGLQIRAGHYRSANYVDLYSGTHPSGPAMFRRFKPMGQPCLKSCINGNTLRMEFGSALDQVAAKVYGVYPETKLVVMETLDGGFTLNGYPDNELDLLRLRIKLKMLLLGVKPWADNGLVHGDYHPGNILSRAEKKGVVSVDFDTVRRKDDESRIWSYHRTFASGEMVHDRKVDPTGDLFYVSALAAKVMGSEVAMATKLWPAHTVTPDRRNRPHDLLPILLPIVKRRWRKEPKALEAAEQIVRMINIGTHPVQGKRHDHPDALLEILDYSEPSIS